MEVLVSLLEVVHELVSQKSMPGQGIVLVFFCERMGVSVAIYKQCLIVCSYLFFA